MERGRRVYQSPLRGPPHEVGGNAVLRASPLAMQMTQVLGSFLHWFICENLRNLRTKVVFRQPLVELRSEVRPLAVLFSSVHSPDHVTGVLGEVKPDKLAAPPGHLLPALHCKTDQHHATGGDVLDVDICQRVAE